MPIEFRCHQCNKLLRVGDDAAGKQAKCPGCGTVQAIPSPHRQGAPSVPLPPPSTAAPAAFDLNDFAGPGASDNPYASPTSTGMPFGHSTFAATQGSRTGPPWERNGPSFTSFLATLQEFYLSPVQFFSQMRREGGLANPLRFVVLGGIIGFMFLSCYGTAYQFIGQNVAVQNQAGFPNNPPAFGNNRQANLVSLVGGFCCCSGVLGPLVTIMWCFGSAALFHLMLLMLGGANFPFETTVRVSAYTLGGSLLFALIPICGVYIVPIVQIVYGIIGLSMAQEVSGGKAAAAVLLPAAICGGGIVALIIAWVFAVAA